MTQVESAPPSLYAAGRKSLLISIAIGWLRALLGGGAVVSTASVIDSAMSSEPFVGALTLVASLLVLRAVLSPVAPLTAAKTSNRVETDLRARALRAALTLGPWSGRRTGETVGRATEGIEAVGALAGTFLPQLVTGMTIPILLSIVVATIDPATAAVLILTLPLVPLLLRLLEKRFTAVSTRYRATADQLAARFVDGVQGIRTLKALDQANAYGDGIADESERLRSETMGLLRVNQLALLAVDTLFTMGTVVAASVMAAIRLSAGAITVGQAVAIVLLGVMLIDPLSQIGRFFYVGAIGRASAAELKGVLAEARHQEVPHTHVRHVRDGSVEFDDVYFAYPDGTEAIQGISFVVKPGERAALVGPSGAGKTTIAHLILGLLQPRTGSVVVGGQPVLVPQRPYLFYGSIRDNLSIGKPEAEDGELWAALDAVDLVRAVEQRPGGLESKIGERGLQLSGGEAQRLAVARALLVNSPVVVLDEPTSNVDLESEARMSEAMERLTDGRTLLIIAHRRSTVAAVDKVIFVRDAQLAGIVSGAAARQRLENSSGPEGWT